MHDMILEIWPSDFLLPSVDAKSLQLLACVRMSAAPVRVIKGGGKWSWTLSDSVPVLKHAKNIRYREFREVVNHLKKQVSEVTLDGHLDRKQLGESLAFQALVQEKLYPAYLNVLWVDLANFNTVTQPWYSSHLPIGYGHIYIACMRKWTEKYLREIYTGNLVIKEDIDYAVNKQAMACISQLSIKLGDQKYFFGDKPCSLDALAFGYLAPLLKLPLPNEKLAQYIRSHPNLVRLVDTLINVYMPLSDDEINVQRESLTEWELKKQKAQDKIRPKPSPDAEHFPLRDKIIFGLGACVVSLLFAVYFGIIQVEVRSIRSRDETSRVPTLPETLVEYEQE